MTGETLGLFIIIGMLIVAMAAFCAAIFYQSKKNNKWMAYTALGFVILAASSVFITSIFAIHLSLKAAASLIAAERFFLVLGLFFFVAYQLQKDNLN